MLESIYSSIYNLLYASKDKRIEELSRELSKVKIELEDAISKIKSIPVCTNKIDELEVYWNNKRPKADLLYSARPAFGHTSKIATDPRMFFASDSRIPTVIGNSNDEKALAALKYVISAITYTSDTTQLKLSECWLFPFETLYYGRGDCVAEYEEIITNGGLKTARDIQIGDLVLSYDFAKKEYIYKPVVNKWDKGVLPIYRVYLRNGQHVDVTKEHKFLVRDSQKTSTYGKEQLGDIDLEKWWKRKLPIARKLPKVDSIPRYPKELYRVIGHFLAEGWVSGSVYSSGYELDDYIIPILEKFDIPHTVCDYGDVPIVRLLKSEFSDYLRTLKENSFDIHIDEHIINLPEGYIREFLYGLWLGDGTKYQYPDKRGYANNKEWTYSTSSEQLSKDLQRIHLYLGEPIHTWKQNNHGGTGNSPIYRLNKNSESHFNKNFGYSGLSEVSIKDVEYIGDIWAYDWEVADTHNFIFSNGTISHNCEDGGILLANIMIKSGIPYWRVRINAGDVKGGGHCFVSYLRESDNQWYIMDWCYWPDESLKGLKWKDAEKYFSIWFSFNTKYIFSGDNLDRQ